MERRINALLIALIALDVWIAAVAFVAPGFWFSTIHGAANVDPQALLQRMGGNWSAFALVQLIALFRWRERPYWLTIVAGVRLSDMFTDWSCLYFCHDITPFGRVALFVASPSNVLIGWYLIHAYRKWEKR